MTALARLLEEGMQAVIDMVMGHYRPPGLRPTQVPKAWVQGLKAAGVKAKVASVYRGSRWVTLPLVVEYPCPNEHVDDTKERFAKVRLLVNPLSGWVTIHEDSCGGCSQQRVESWLMTCPRCAAGEDTEEHGDHPLFYLPEGDESPLAFVVETMAAMVNGLTSEPEPKPERKEWDRASAVLWLDNLTHEDGAYVVPPLLGQRAAWDAVRTMPGHPPQVLVREAQAARKRRATEPPDG